MGKAEAHFLPDGAKARQVYLSVRNEIADGRLSDGESLPGEQRLAESFGVSRVTVRRALQALVNDGLIERRAGSGTVVRIGSATPTPVALNLATLVPQVVDIGRTTTAHLLSFSYGSAPLRVREDLGLGADEKVQIATRVRITESTPYSHLTTYVPECIARNYSENDLATTPLYELLELSGVQIDAARQTVSATLAAPDVAEALEVAVGSALLSLHRVVLDVNGAGVEYLAGLYRPDMFRLDMALNRVGEGGERHWTPTIGPRSVTTP